ncbi:MAG: hypothetical protein B6244_08795 [Candidatus Cloacimonetes bacterium 4572_55]|nr:MAG: hypothetical protein B6244_08795 [Candidatus Cloacimonetes bacterium 4572_55]
MTAERDQKDVNVSRIAQARKKLKRLPVEQKIAIAPRSSPELLDLLLELKNPQVTLAALDNPNMNEKKILWIVRDLSTSAEVLDKIGQNKIWMRLVKIHIEMVKNPNIPKSLAMQLLSGFSIIDLVYLLGASRGMQPGMRQRMLDIFRQRISQAGEEQRTQLLGRGPSDVTQIIVDLGGDRVLSYAIRYNHIRQYHAIKIAKGYQSSPKLLTLLFETPPWGQQYDVRLSLLMNDNTPRDIRLKVFRGLTKADQENFRRKHRARGLSF